MTIRNVSLGVCLVLASASVAVRAQANRHDDLVALFKEWRTFQQPPFVRGVPDYRTSALATQRGGLVKLQQRLRAMDPAAWPVPQQVDWHIVRAEMNGLDFDHRVLRPWTNNPAFYATIFADESDQPAREGPHAAGTVELFRYKRPFSAADAAVIDSGLRMVAPLIEQAHTNLTGNQKDIWTYGIGALKEQSGVLKGLADELAGMPGNTAALKADVATAKAATDAFVQWLEARAPSKTGPSGIGVDNYNWYLKNVQLLPYSWHDLVGIMELELARSWAFLALEEGRNAKVPPLTVVSSSAEHTKRFGQGVTDYIAFIKDHDLLTMKPYMDPRVRARVGMYSAQPREFFTEVDYRDPMVMRTHGFHWFDKGEMAETPHASAIRRGPVLYNIFNTRTEGFATEWEEMMMGAGMFDRSPHSRELIYILVAERAARALGDLRMQSNEYTLEQAATFAAANTPRGWLSLKGNLVRGEQHLYLQQPGYGISYVVGKVESEKTLQAVQRSLGDKFVFRKFMDDFLAAGQIPISLVRWEVTGALTPDLRELLKGTQRE
jgi:hypothetical protein